jgi:hypothetical protein
VGKDRRNEAGVPSLPKAKEDAIRAALGKPGRPGAAIFFMLKLAHPEGHMALSDSCFDFLQAVSTAAADLARDVHHYSAPDSPIAYGSEIDALRRACAAVTGAPYDPETGARLLRLAASVMAFHDTPPETQEASTREADMRKLVRLLQDALDGDDAAAVPSVVENVVTETGYTRRAADRLNVMLPKLGKSAYDVAIKIISDIGSATVKKLLGL